MITSPLFLISGADAVTYRAICSLNQQHLGPIAKSMLENALSPVGIDTDTTIKSLIDKRVIQYQDEKIWATAFFINNEVITKKGRFIQRLLDLSKRFPTQLAISPHTIFLQQITHDCWGLVFVCITSLL